MGNINSNIDNLGKNKINEVNPNENKKFLEKNINTDNIDEITIQYKIDKIDYSKEIKIFGEKFVENNKINCKMIIKGNEFEICTNLNININQLDNDIFEIKLKGITISMI